MNDSISEDTLNKILVNYQQYKKNQDVKELERIKAKLVRDWQSDFDLLSENQENQDPNYHRTTDHLCSNGCAEEKRIELIDSETQFYVCTKSGFYHFCQGNIKTCVDRSLNMDLEIVCAFSGIIIAANMINDWRQDASKNVGNQEGEGEEKEEYTCIEVCDSNDEGEAVMDIYDEFVAPLQEENPTKRHSRGKKNQSGILIKSQIDDLAKQICVIVDDLIYNKKERQRLNEIKMQSMKKQTETEMKKYFKILKNEKRRPCRHLIGGQCLE